MYLYVLYGCSVTFILSLFQLIFWQIKGDAVKKNLKLKNWGHTADRYSQDATFSFYSFFYFSVWKSSKMAEMCPKMVKIQLWATYNRHSSLQCGRIFTKIGTITGGVSRIHQKKICTPYVRGMHVNVRV